MSTENLFISIIANYVYEKLKHLWTKCRQKFVPRKTMIFVPNTPDEIHQHWHNVELRGEPAMSIHSTWYATNLTNEPMWLLTAYLEKPRTDAMMLLTKSPESDLFDRFPILPRVPGEVIVDLCIQPVVCKHGESFKGKIVFIDHYNKKHKIRAIFKPPIYEEGELIFGIRLRQKYQDELNNKILPNAIRKKLKSQGISLSHNLKIYVQATKWLIKDSDRPRVVYTAKIEDKNLNLYKLFKPPRRQVRAAPTTWTPV